MMIRHKMKSIVIVFVASACGIGLFGCVDLPSVSEVEEFRVLGMKAEPPEIAPGEGTRLEILWADPEGNGREVSFAWMGCSGYIHSSQGLSTCDMVIPPIVQTAEEGGDVLEIPETPEDILEYDITGSGKVSATFIVLMCAGGKLPAPDEYKSKRNVENINTLCKGGDGISVYKTITISESSDPQRNPVLERLKANGKIVEMGDDADPLEVRCKEKKECGAEVTFRAFFEKESLQDYETIEYGKPKTVDERMYVSWFVTGGSVDMSRAGPEGDDLVGPYETKWSPEEPGTFTLYVVGHDDRGGASWQTYTIDVLPK
jgi:hypothetical protein